MKNKKIFIIMIILIFAVLIGVFTFENGINYSRVKGDSGFDVDYDSSWDNDSSWSNYSWWDNSYYDNKYKSYHNTYNQDNDKIYNDSDIKILLLVFAFALFMYALCMFMNILPKNINKNIGIYIILLIIIKCMMFYWFYDYYVYVYTDLGISLVLALVAFIINSKNSTTTDEDLTSYVNSMYDGTVKYSNYKILKEEMHEKLIGNINDFLTNRYSDFLMIQEGWMNFDYDSLKDKLTNEMYNEYVMQLENLRLKNQKNVMSDFEFINSFIVNVIEQNNIIETTINLSVKFYDYIEENGKVIRGNNKKKVTMEYELKFISNKVKNNICSKCGNELDDIATEECPYCQNKIVKVPSKWVMSIKRVISQR